MLREKKDEAVVIQVRVIMSADSGVSACPIHSQVHRATAILNIKFIVLH
jgi:hypothetical protein